MPKIPATVKLPNELNSYDLFNTLRSSMGADFQAAIPEAYKPLDNTIGGVESAKAIKSLYAIGEAFSSFPNMANNFITAMINRVARVMVTSRAYENPWRRFKKGYLEWGETVEEIFVGLCKVAQFDPEKAEVGVLKRRQPDVQTAFHQMNFQKFYTVSVSPEELHQAFLTESGLTDLLGRIVEQLYTSQNYDEFLVMKYMVAREALNGGIYPQNVPVINSQNAREVTVTMATAAKNLSYMNRLYNRAGVRTYTDPRYLQIILTSQVSSVLDVEVLALSFNMEKAELLGNQIGVDSFQIWDNERLEEIFANDPYTDFTPFTETELAQLATIQAIMVDESWFMIFDNLITNRDYQNGEGLYITYFYHVWQTYSTSPFAQAILYTSDTVGVTSVAVTPTTATASKGQNVQFSETILTTGFASKNVTWSVTGEKDVVSTISPTGNLSIAQNETNTSLTVTVTSVADPSKSATATVTVA